LLDPLAVGRLEGLGWGFENREPVFQILSNEKDTVDVRATHRLLEFAFLFYILPCGSM
jgi:hypothetical protein